MTRLVLVACLVWCTLNALADTAPEQAVVIDLHRPWLDGANWDGNTPPIVYGVDATVDQPRFSLIDLNAFCLWVYRFALPIDVARYPILTMKYRAKNASAAAPYVLRLVGGNGGRTRFDAFKGSDLVADGKEHELKQDLRELNMDGALVTFGIGLKTDTQPAFIDLIELKFSAVDSTKEKFKDEPPLRIRVTDQNDQPIVGAKVIVDAERSNFARTGTTNNNGDATITPLANEQSKHMVRVEKAGYLTIEMPNAQSESGQALVVKTMPAVRYGGIAKDAAGKVAALAQISIKLKPELLQDIPTRFQTDIVTDERGAWSSLPLPADASEVMIALSQRDAGDKTIVTTLGTAAQQIASKTSEAKAPPIPPPTSAPQAVDSPSVAAASKPVDGAPLVASTQAIAIEPVTAIIKKIDDTEVIANWNGIDGDQITAAPGAQGKTSPAKIALADINEISLKRPAFSLATPSTALTSQPAGKLANCRIVLADDDGMNGSLVAWSDKHLQFVPSVAPESTIDIPIASLRELWCGAAEQIKKAQSLKEQPGLDDIAFAVRDGEIVAVHGIALGIDGDSLHFRFENADRKIALDRLVGLIMAKADDAPAVDALYESIQFVNDDQLSGTLSALNGKMLTMQTRAGASVNLPIDQVARISIHNGRQVFLSDLKPTHVEQTPYFDRMMEYRFDKSLTGKPITLADGTYARGVSMHSRCVLTYNLDGRFGEFRSKVGFLLPEGKAGDCVIRVTGDGKTLFEKLDARGDQPPADLKLDVGNVREMTLEVDYGRNDDVADRVAFANARLLRAGH